MGSFCECKKINEKTPEHLKRIMFLLRAESITVTKAFISFLFWFPV